MTEFKVMRSLFLARQHSGPQALPAAGGKAGCEGGCLEEVGACVSIRHKATWPKAGLSGAGLELPGSMWGAQPFRWGSKRR